MSWPPHIALARPSCFDAEDRQHRNLLGLGPPAFLALSLLGLLLAPSARAQAQREVVEDSWAAAEAQMAAEAPPPRPRARRRPTRAERRAAMEQRLAWEAAEAHVIRSGDVRLQLHAPRGMTWVWLGDADEPSLGWRLRASLSLCGRSCEVSLPVGRVRLGLRTRAGQVAISDAFTVARPGRVRGHYVSRGRTIGAAVAILLAGNILGAAGIYGTLRGLRSSRAYFPALGLSVGLIASVHVVGIFMIGRSRPRVSLDFTPAMVR